MFVIIVTSTVCSIKYRTCICVCHEHPQCLHIRSGPIAAHRWRIGFGIDSTWYDSSVCTYIAWYISYRGFEASCENKHMNTGKNNILNENRRKSQQIVCIRKNLCTNLLLSILSTDLHSLSSTTSMTTFVLWSLDSSYFHKFHTCCAHGNWITRFYYCRNNLNTTSSLLLLFKNPLSPH